MNCPNCKTNSGSIYKNLVADKTDPITCSECGTKYYVKRYLSGMFEHGLIGSGLIFIIMFLMFAQWGWLGVGTAVLLSFCIWFVLAKIETDYLTVIELTKENEQKGRQYLLAVRVVILGVLLVVIYTVFL